PLAEDKAVALLVEGPAGGWGIVVAAGEGAGRDKAAQAHRRDGGLGAAANHDVGVVVLNGAQGVADGVGGGGAGGGHGGVRPHQAKVDGDVPGGCIGDHFGDDERSDPAGAFLHVDRVLILEFPQPADAATDNDATAERVLPGEVDTAIL